MSEQELLTKYEPFIRNTVIRHGSKAHIPVYQLPDYEDRLQEARLAFLQAWRRIGKFNCAYFGDAICGALSQFVAEMGSCVTIQRNEFYKHCKNYVIDEMKPSDYAKLSYDPMSHTNDFIALSQCAKELPYPGNRILPYMLQGRTRREAIEEAKLPMSTRMAYRYCDEAINQLKHDFYETPKMEVVH